MASIRVRSVALLLLASLAACTTAPRAPYPPVQGARAQELRLSVEPFSSAVRPLEGSFEAAVEGRRVVNVRVRLLRAPAQPVAQAVGGQASSLFGVVCSRDQARGLVEALLAEGGGGVEVNDMTLTLQEDQDGYLTVLNQRAYVAGFELVAGRQGVVADPRVDVAQDGVLLQLRASREPGAAAWALALALTCVELDLPLAQRELDLVGGGAPVTLQVPGGLVRRLTCGASPAADEALLLGGGALSSAALGDGLLLLVELDELGADGQSIARR